MREDSDETLRVLQGAIDESMQLRRAARDEAGAGAQTGCHVVAGTASGHPELDGSPHHYRWRGRFKTWKGSYVASTLQVRVPAGWLASRILGTAPASGPDSASASTSAIEAAVAEVRAAAEARETRRRKRAGTADSALTSQPNWLDRAAVGKIRIPPGISTGVRRRINLRYAEIDTLRRKRKLARIDRAGQTRIFVPFRSKAGDKLLLTLRGPARTGSLYSDPHWLLEGRSCFQQFHTKRGAIRRELEVRATRKVWESAYAEVHYARREHKWTVTDKFPNRDKHFIQWTDPKVFSHCPTRMEVASFLRDNLARSLCRVLSAQPSESQPSTLGWRTWVLDTESKTLLSPSILTKWPDPELRCDDWDAGNALRGAKGIHACRMPRNWRHAGIPSETSIAASPQTRRTVLVTGVVERFGRYVLGKLGWRAEWVVIRELQAPTVESQLILERMFPDVPVHLAPDAKTRGDIVMVSPVAAGQK